MNWRLAVSKMKDPAALMYIDKYLSATAEMDADCVGWYTKLIMHQYDKKDLPNDIEKLAALCNVKFSEFKRFEQVFEQVLKQKFIQNDNGRLEQEFAKEILIKRQNFTNKRSKSGSVGYIIKLFKSESLNNIYDYDKVKKYLYSLEVEKLEEAKNKQMLKQMLKQNDKLYINVNENKDINIDNNIVLDIINENEILFNPIRMEFNDIKDIDFAIEQYSYAEMSKDNPALDTRRIMFGLKKWLNSWRQNSKTTKNIKDLSNDLLNDKLSANRFKQLYPNFDYKDKIAEFYSEKYKSNSNKDTYMNFNGHFFNWMKK